MKERHWDRIAKTTSHTFDFESDTFQLRNIMEAPLLEFKEDIEVSFKGFTGVMLNQYSMVAWRTTIFEKHGSPART
jgi:hypothetical protein